MSLGLIIDIILGALLIISIIVGAIRGLFKTVIAVVITIASVILAVVLSGIFVDRATDWVYPRVQEKLEQSMSDSSIKLDIGGLLKNATEGKIEDFLEYELTDDYFDKGIAEDIVKIAEQFGLSEKDVRGALEKGLKKAQTLLKDYLEKEKTSPESAQAAVDDAVETTGKELIRPIVRAGLGIILFILLSIILRILGGIIDRAMKKTQGVKQINSAGGAILSLVETVVIIYVLIYVLNKFGFTTIYQEQLAGSYIVQFLLRYIPS